MPSTLLKFLHEHITLMASVLGTRLGLMYVKIYMHVHVGT